jgi:hypothetical protein
MAIAYTAESFSTSCADRAQFIASVCGFIPVVHTPQAGAPGTPMATHVFRKLVQRIREEFENAPDLRMTANEAARFFGLDLAMCERVLAELRLVGFLARDADERYAHPA